MKISERKQRLRTRGVVPVSQEATPRHRTVAVPAQARSKAATRATRGGTAARQAPRPRWQPSPGYQLAFGAAYIIFTPILFIENIAVMRDPHAKHQPGILEFSMPVVFFLFGLWFVYRGLQARRRKGLAAAATTAPADKTRLAKGS